MLIICYYWMLILAHLLTQIILAVNNLQIIGILYFQIPTALNLIPIKYVFKLE